MGLHQIQDFRAKRLKKHKKQNKGKHTEQEKIMNYILNKVLIYNHINIQIIFIDF